MLGCIGVAPPRKEAILTGTPGVFGGNLDYFGMNEGVTVMLPVFEPGALLFLGDGHARQGHGEVVGNALEVSMNVEFSVDLIKDKRIRWPRIENDDYIMVLGSARPLLQALQHATTGYCQLILVGARCGPVENGRLGFNRHTSPDARRGGATSEHSVVGRAHEMRRGERLSPGTRGGGFSAVGAI